MYLAADNLAKLALAPLLIGQALHVRRKALILPEPPGERTGQTGSGAALNILIAGDSSAAGVGADSQGQALSGRLAQELAARFTVCWTLEAETGATSAATLRRLRELHKTAPQRFDVVLFALGVNDITRGVPLRRWLKTQQALQSLMTETFGARRILVSGVPPMHRFPLLPQPLRWTLGATARRFDTALAGLCAENPAARHLAFDLPFRPEYVARDGFHPSPAAYALWARMLADKIAG